MAILRVVRKKHFTVIPNNIIRDQSLSLRAKMILVTYLSNVDGFEVSNEYLRTTCRDGEESIASAVNELISAGYYKRDRYQAERGRWNTCITITTEPFQFDDEDSPTPGKPGPGEPGVGRRTPGVPGPGRPGGNRRTREEEPISYESSGDERYSDTGRQSDMPLDGPQVVVPLKRQRRPRSGLRRMEVPENSPTETAGRTIGMPHATDRSKRIANERAAVARPDSGGGLSRYFGILASQAGLAGPQQVNGAALAKNLTSWMSDGQNPDTPAVIRAMMEQFFASPKPRSDRPLWRRFLAEAPALRVAHAKAQPIDYRAAESRFQEQVKRDAARGDVRAQQELSGENRPWRNRREA